MKTAPSVTVQRGDTVRVLNPAGAVVPYTVADIIQRRVLLRWGASGVRYEFAIPHGQCLQLPGWTIHEEDLARLVSHAQTRYVSVSGVSPRVQRQHRPHTVAPGQRSLF